jgi:hypothetical protein
MAKQVRIYEVTSVYKVAGIARIAATSAAEAARIGQYGTDDGGEVQFDFTEPFGETKMRARRVEDDDTYTNDIRRPLPSRG